MRHRVDHRKLGRTASHRRALMRSMVTSLFQSERITTTAPKAKEVRRVAERLITRAKKGHRAHQEGAGAVALAHWRQAGRIVRSPDVLRKLFDQIAPHFLERNGGYTRIIRLDQHRLGDNARLVLLELVDTEVTKKPLIRGPIAKEAEPEKAEKKQPARRRAKKAAPAVEASAETKEKKEKKDKKARPARSKAAGETGGKAKAKSDKKGKAGDGGKKAAPRTRSKSRKSGE